MRSSRSLPASALLVLALLAALAGRTPAHAFGSYPPGAIGADIGSQQCGGAFATLPGAFGIVAITGGRAFYQNACLVSEYAWAQSAAAPPSLFMNLNAPAGTTAFKARTGPRGTCAAADSSCLAYNYGFNAAQSAFADAQSQQTTATFWWLDIESGNTWADQTALNVLTIQGAIDALRGHDLQLGLYSAPGQWRQIAGDFQPGLPVWVAGAPDAAGAPGYRTPAQGFGGGAVWLVQYVVNSADADYVCPVQAAKPPAAPAALQAVAVDAARVQLSWTAAAETVEAYGIYTSTGQSLSISGGLKQYVVSGLTPNTPYCFTLYAANAAGTSGWSAWACVNTSAGGG